MDLPSYIPRDPVPGRDLIHYAGPFWDECEINAAVRSLTTGKWISAGEAVRRFENEFSAYFGHGASLMVNSGSSANLVMLSALKMKHGWGPGDEVIVSVVGFPTTVAPIIQCGLTPRFVDITMSDLNFDLSEVDRVINERTVAIFLSPVLGNPPDIAKLLEICYKRCTLILDGCDSLGTRWQGKWLSDYAEATSCSFYPAHHICTGEGGMVSSQDKELITLARKFAHWGRDCYCVGAANALAKGSCNNRFASHLGDAVGIVDHKYVFSEIGYNMKPLDLQGAIGSEQLKKFDRIHSSRRRIKERLSRALPEGCHSVSEPEGTETGWFGVPIICDTSEIKQRMVQGLERARIQTRNYFAGNLLSHPGYSGLGAAADYPNANEVLRRVFFIGCHPGYDEETLNYIEQVLHESL